jgi:hypothetical protein
MTLQPIVDLYRAASRPALDGSSEFSASLDASVAVPLIGVAAAAGKGRFELLEVDGSPIDIASIHAVKVGVVHFIYRVVPRDNSTFHPNLASLLRSGTEISRGQYPKDFYIVDQNFYSEDVGDKPSNIIALIALCTIIRGLQSLAIYHDQKNAARLVFVAPSESSIPHVVIEPRITEDLLGLVGDQIDLRIIEDLTEGAGEGDPHRSAKCGVFGVTITDFLKSNSPNESFDYLVKNWTGFLEAYQKNLGTYLSGFAFHKAKREVAKAELEFAEQYGKLIGEIATKLFSIPLSFAVIATLPKITVVESVVVVLGLVVVGIIVQGTISNQRLQLDRVKNAKELLLGSIEGRQDSYPPELKEAIKNMRSQLESNESDLWKRFRLFVILGWLPLATGLLVVGFENKEFNSSLYSVYKKASLVVSDVAENLSVKLQKFKDSNSDPNQQPASVSPN